MRSVFGAVQRCLLLDVLKEVRLRKSKECREQKKLRSDAANSDDQPSGECTAQTPYVPRVYTLHFTTGERS
jgi:hypothetical protein